MKANPGGTIDPMDVIGRDGLIERLWEILERQSVVLTAERRMGKTCVIEKMRAETPTDRLTVYHDLEGVRTPLEFVEIVFHDVEKYLTRFERTAVRVRKFLASLSGASLGGIIKFPKIAAVHWKVLLEKTLEDLAEHQNHLVVLFWDEFPLMLKNFIDKNGDAVAMELLDVLRALRQTHKQLRMVFTGSIGLHNVIASLKGKGYANAPINDMHTMELPSLSPPDAADLATRLLTGEGFVVDPLDPTPEMIANSVDCVPYYIHHVVDQMKQQNIDCTPETVQKLIANCLTDPLDRWELQHYKDRLGTYYDTEEQPYVLALLDTLASENQPLHFADLFNHLKSQISTGDKERVRDLMLLLQRDHYVIQKSDGRYCFRYPLIQQWWQLHRGLTK